MTATTHLVAGYGVCSCTYSGVGDVPGATLPVLLWLLGAVGLSARRQVLLRAQRELYERAARQLATLVKAQQERWRGDLESPIAEIEKQQTHGTGAEREDKEEGVAGEEEYSDADVGGGRGDQIQRDGDAAAHGNSRSKGSRALRKASISSKRGCSWM